MKKFILSFLIIFLTINIYCINNINIKNIYSYSKYIPLGKISKIGKINIFIIGFEGCGNCKILEDSILKSNSLDSNKVAIYSILLNKSDSTITRHNNYRTTKTYKSFEADYFPILDYPTVIIYSPSGNYFSKFSETLIDSLKKKDSIIYGNDCFTSLKKQITYINNQYKYFNIEDVYYYDNTNFCLKLENKLKYTADTLKMQNISKVKLFISFKKKWYNTELKIIIKNYDTISNLIPKFNITEYDKDNYSIDFTDYSFICNKSNKLINVVENKLIISKKYKLISSNIDYINNLISFNLKN